MYSQDNFNSTPNPQFEDEQSKEVAVFVRDRNGNEGSVFVGSLGISV